MRRVIPGFALGTCYPPLSTAARSVPNADAMRRPCWKVQAEDPHFAVERHYIGYPGVASRWLDASSAPAQVAAIVSALRPRIESALSLQLDPELELVALPPGGSPPGAGSAASWGSSRLVDALEQRGLGRRHRVLVSLTDGSAAARGRSPSPAGRAGSAAPSTRTVLSMLGGRPPRGPILLVGDVMSDGGSLTSCELLGFPVDTRLLVVGHLDGEPVADAFAPREFHATCGRPRHLAPRSSPPGHRLGTG